MKAKFAAFLAVSLTVIAIISVVSYRSLQRLRTIEESRWHTATIPDRLDSLLSNVIEAESKTRDFLVTGNTDSLKYRDSAVGAVHGSFESIRQMAKGDRYQQQRLDALAPLLKECLELMDETIAPRRTRGISEASETLRLGRVHELIGQIGSIVAAMQRETQQLLVTQSAAFDSTLRVTFLILVTSSVTGAALAVFIGFITFGEMKNREKYEKQLHSAHESLNQSTKELVILSEMSDLIQVCSSLEEASTVIRRFIPRLLPGFAGALYLLNASREVFEPWTLWGDFALLAAFEPTDCWAIRRGHTHTATQNENGVRCLHADKAAEGATYCVPLVSLHDPFGLLHLQAMPQSSEASSSLAAIGQELKYDSLIRQVAEVLAPSIANLRLRSTLLDRSLRDGLTGLFNRRYMEESIIREIGRAERYNRSLGIIMLDLDHFKDFNDSFGHTSGDALLRALGRFLETQIRREDIACRYGGEEFLLVLPDASLETTRERAELLRENVKILTWSHRKDSSRTVTLSAGVAAFPQHGRDWQSVLGAADRALCTAKNSGRNQVVVAGQGDGRQARLVKTSH